MVEKLLVRLIGDGTRYREMIDDAVDRAKKFQSTFEGVNNRLKTSTKSAMARIRSVFSNTFADMERSLKRIGDQATRLGRTLSIGLTAPLAIIGGLAVREFAKFDHAMVESTSIMNATEDQMKRMRETALSLSRQSIQGPEKLAKSFFFLASAGLDAEQAMKALPAVTKFATAGAFDMALATDLLTDAQSALGRTVQDATENLRNMEEISDLLVKANTLANASVQQFSTALTTKAGAAIKSYNLDVRDAIAVLAAYADQGVKAELAGEAFGRVTRLMTKAARDNAAAFEQMNIQVFDGQGEFRAFSQIIGDMERALGDMSTEAKAAALEALGFEARIQSVILPLIGTSEAIARYREELEQAGGTTEQVANRQMTSFTNQLRVLGNRLRVIGITIANDFVPALRTLNNILGGLISLLEALPAPIRRITVAVAALTAAIGPLLAGLGFLAKGVALSLPLLTKIGTVAKVVAGFLGSRLVVSIFGATASFVELGSVLGTIGSAFTLVSNPIGIAVAVIGGLIATLRIMTGSWSGALNAVKGFFTGLIDWTVTGIAITIRTMRAFVGFLGRLWSEFWEGEWLAIIGRGLVASVKKIGDFASGIARVIKDAVTNPLEFLGRRNRLLDQLLGMSQDLASTQSDFAKGREDLNFLNTIKDITREEIAALNARRQSTQELDKQLDSSRQQVRTQQDAKDLQDSISTQAARQASAQQTTLRMQQASNQVARGSGVAQDQRRMEDFSKDILRDVQKTINEQHAGAKALEDLTGRILNQFNRQTDRELHGRMRQLRLPRERAGEERLRIQEGALRDLRAQLGREENTLQGMEEASRELARRLGEQERLVATDPSKDAQIMMRALRREKGSLDQQIKQQQNLVRAQRKAGEQVEDQLRDQRTAVRAQKREEERVTREAELRETNAIREQQRIRDRAQRTLEREQTRAIRERERIEARVHKETTEAVRKRKEAGRFTDRATLQQIEAESRRRIAEEEKTRKMIERRARVGIEREEAPRMHQARERLARSLERRTDASRREIESQDQLAEEIRRFQIRQFGQEGLQGITGRNRLPESVRRQIVTLEEQRRPVRTRTAEQRDAQPITFKPTIKVERPEEFASMAADIKQLVRLTKKQSEKTPLELSTLNLG